MNRSTLRYATSAALSAALCLSIHGSASAGAGEDVGDDRLETVKVARSEDHAIDAQTGQSDDRTELDKASLSVGIALPMLNPNPTIPQVVMSEQHKKSCLKRVGDQLESIALMDVGGREVKLHDELSDRFTVLILWSQTSVAGYEQFRRIPVELLAKFAPYRVKVVAVNVGGNVQETQRLTGKAADKILSLADPNSDFFKTLATRYIPRTYVVDADGRIVWFEIEYSESSRRALDNALTYFLQLTPAVTQ